MRPAILGILCAAFWAGAGAAEGIAGHLETDDLPAHLRDRGEGMPLSIFGTYVQKGQLQTRQEMLRAALWDQRQLTVEEARAKFGEIVVDLEKIETLRKRISGMGPINSAAPEEYEALAQRQSFLTAQLSDLTQAKDDLKAAIQKINSTTRENFRQTFSDAR